MRLKTFSPGDVFGKKVLVRVDFNVPLADGEVSDATRIRAHLPTLEALRSAGASIALVSHLGRPKGTVDKKFSLAPAGKALKDMTGWNVVFVPDCVGPEVGHAVASWKKDDVLLLENVRFHAEEEKNDINFARELAKWFDIFVMDAFSAAHRAHASTSSIARIIPSFAGLLLLKEIEILSTVRDNPGKPFVLILGGAKVSDKIGVVSNMMTKVDTILIGGGMAFTFLKAMGYEIGSSLCEEEKIGFASEMLAEAAKRGVKILLPTDLIVADAYAADASHSVVNADSIPAGKMGLDIGPKTAETFRNVILSAKTVLWNGPMGVFEMPAFAKGTQEVAKAMADATQAGALTVIGGGDSAAAAAKFRCDDKVSHVSMGGGASLEFFEGKILPGIEPYILE